MKLAMSNIAWPAERELEVADLLVKLGVKGVEVAPTKNWASPPDAPASEVERYRSFWNDRGIAIIAAQALLFGRPELVLFSDAATRARTGAYLAGMCRTCGALGARALVFGAPKNRSIGALSLEKAEAIAVEFFRALGQAAVETGTTIVLEANPTDYGADFITHARAALALVQQVDHPGFGLHLDTACMHLAGDDAETIAREAVRAGVLQHVHFSAPYLAPLMTAQNDISYASFAHVLRDVGYTGWISIEMRVLDPFDIGLLENVIAFAQHQLEVA